MREREIANHWKSNQGESYKSADMKVGRGQGKKWLKFPLHLGFESEAEENVGYNSCSQKEAFTC